jgi:hypothetical protein
MPDYASHESDLDPDCDSSKDPESAGINDTPTYESSSEDALTDNDSAVIQTQEESPLSTTRPSRARQPDSVSKPPILLALPDYKRLRRFFGTLTPHTRKSA